MSASAVTSPRPVLVYDGDCGICTSSVGFISRHLSTDLDVVAWQHADLSALGLTQQQCENAVQWVAPDGRTSAGHIAVGRLLKHSGLRWWPLGALALTPPFSWVARGVYRLVADNRDKLPGGTPACALPAELRPGATTAKAQPGQPDQQNKPNQQDQPNQLNEPDQQNAPNQQNQQQNQPDQPVTG